MTSGYVLCPCCGYDTAANDDTQPELCEDCEQAGCDCDGSDPRCESSMDLDSDGSNDFEIDGNGGLQ